MVDEYSLVSCNHIGPVKSLKKKKPSAPSFKEKRRWCWKKALVSSFKNKGFREWWRDEYDFFESNHANNIYYYIIIKQFQKSMEAWFLPLLFVFWLFNCYNNGRGGNPLIYKAIGLGLSLNLSLCVNLSFCWHSTVLYLANLIF